MSCSKVEQGRIESDYIAAARPLESARRAWYGSVGNGRRTCLLSCAGDFRRRRVVFPRSVGWFGFAPAGPEIACALVSSTSEVRLGIHRRVSGWPGGWKNKRMEAPESFARARRLPSLPHSSWDLGRDRRDPLQPQVAAGFCKRVRDDSQTSGSVSYPAFCLSSAIRR